MSFDELPFELPCGSTQTCNLCYTIIVLVVVRYYKYYLIDPPKGFNTPIGTQHQCNHKPSSFWASKRMESIVQVLTSTLEGTTYLVTLHGKDQITSCEPTFVAPYLVKSPKW